MQTAVEWLAEKMMHPQIFNPYIEQAKDMEKKKILMLETEIQELRLQNE